MWTNNPTQISKLPVGTVAAKATNCIYQHSCRSHQVKTHHWHIFFFFSFFFSSTVQKSLQGKLCFFFPCPLSPAPSAQSTRTLRASLSLRVIQPKRLDAAMNAHGYKTSGLGRCFCHPFRSGYKAGTDCKCTAAQYVKGTGDKEPPPRVTSLLRSNLTAGCPTPAPVPLRCYLHHFRPPG